MFINGKFEVPKEWPQRAREDIAALCAMNGEMPSNVVIAPWTLPVPWAKNCLAIDGIYANVMRDGEDIVVEGDPEQGFPLNGVCVIIQAVMRHYEIGGVAVITTSGTPESDDESHDGMISVVSPQGVAHLCTTPFQNMTNPTDIFKHLAGFVAEVSGKPVGIDKMVVEAGSRLAEARDQVLLTRTDDGEICLYGNLYGQMDGSTVTLSLSTQAQPEEILTEALQRANKEWPHEPSHIDSSRLRIFRDLFPFGAANTMASTAREMGYEVVVDRMAEDDRPEAPERPC